MKVIIDTNVIISAALFPERRAAKSFFKALLPPFEPLFCDYIVDELHRKFREKFPEKQAVLAAFLSQVLPCVRVVTSSTAENQEEKKIRDPKDRPILRAALQEHVDLFLTGDKDFLESSVKYPRIISVADFLDL